MKFRRAILSELTPEYALGLYNKHAKSARAYRTGVYMAARQPGSMAIVRTIRLRTSAGCNQMPGLDVKAMWWGYMRLARKGLIPCALIRVSCNRYLYSDFGGGVGTGLWDLPLGMDVYSVFTTHRPERFHVGIAWAKNRRLLTTEALDVACAYYNFGDQHHMDTEYKMRTLAGTIRLGARLP